MISKFTFNESIKRVYNCITNSQIIYYHVLKDYISDIKIVNDFRKRETKDEKKDANNNSKSIIKNSNNDSSQNLYNNNVASKTNNSIHPILTLNNSFLFLNSSLNSINVEKLEGLIFECRWKKKIYFIT